MPHIPENWAELLTPGLREVFERTLAESIALSQRQALFNVVPSQRAFEEAIGVGGLSNRGWNISDSGRVQYDTVRKLWPVRWDHIPFAKGIQIQRELIADNLYAGLGLPRSITEQPEVLAENAEIFREMAAAEVFNNGFTDSGITPSGFSMTGPDGVALFSDNHANTPADATLQSNKVALALNTANLSAARLKARKWKDDRGNPRPANLTHLVVSPENEDIATVATRSPQLPGGNNNDINVNAQAGRVTKITVWEYLTSTTAWFYLDELRRNRYLLWFERDALEFAGQESFDTLRGKWRAYMRWSRGPASPWIGVGSTG